MTAYRLEIWRRSIKVLANVLVLAAVAVGMYQASFQPDEMLSVFCSWFFSLLLAILAATWLAFRLLRRYFPVDAKEDLDSYSVVEFPGKGSRLVRWSVLSTPEPRYRKK